MKKIAILMIFFLFPLFIFSQKNYSGQVLDKDNLEPIEFANIFNEKNYTITNEDGKFDFNSSLDSIYIKLLGYKILKTTTNQLPKNGIIYLEPKSFELDEVIVSNENSTFKKMIKTIKDISPEGYNEEFFLRTILKRNDTIIKIQDLNGVVNRKILISTTENPITKKNYTVYVNDMRKAGYKEDNIYFKLLNFKVLLTEFVRINFPPKLFSTVKTEVKEDNLIRLDFKPKDEKTDLKGYYLINSSDNYLQKIYWIAKRKPEFSKNGPLKYRTIEDDLSVNFFKENNQYRIKNAKKNYKVECYYQEGEKIIFDVTYIYKTKELNQNIITSNKVSTKKDIFKIKHPFNEVYWDNNPHLKLTDEMSAFIKNLEESNLKTDTNFKK